MNIKKILSFALGPLASAGFGLVIIPIMTWYFSPEDMGRMRVFQVILSFCLLFSVLGLDQAYVREYHGSKDKDRLFKACFFPGFFLLIICVLASLSFQIELTRWIFGMENFNIYKLTISCILLNYFARFQSLILRMQERGLAYSMSQVIPKLMQLVLIGIIVWSGAAPQFSLLLLILAASMATVVLVYSWNTRKELLMAFRARIDRTELHTLIKFGFPLVFSGLAYWALTATSTIMLRAQSTMAELGVYSVVSSIATVAAIFQSIFTVVWAPTVYKWVHQGVDMAKIDIIAQQALSIVCLIFAAVGTFAWMTDYLLPPLYSSIKYLLACAVAPQLLYTLSEITCIGIAITRRTTLTIWITIIALLTNILLSMYLIPDYGATGAVVSNALAYFVFFVGRTESSARVWLPFRRLKIYLYLMLVIILGILIAFLGDRLIFPHLHFMAVMIPLIVGGLGADLKMVYDKIK